MSTVHYDGKCGLCRREASHEKAPHYIRLEILEKHQVC